MSADGQTQCLDHVINGMGRLQVDDQQENGSVMLLNPTTPISDLPLKHDTSHECKSNVCALLEKYVQNGDRKYGDEMLKAASRDDLTEEDAKHILLRLINLKPDLQFKFDIIAALLAQEKGKTAIVSLVTEDEKTFVELLEQTCGSRLSSLDKLITILLGEASWVNHVEQRDRLLMRAVYVLFENLHRIDADQTEPAIMHCLAKLISREPACVVSKLSPDHFKSVLLFLSVGTPASLRSLATIFTAKTLEVTPEKSKNWLTEFIVTRVAMQTTDDFIVAFSVAATVFPIVPTISAALFLTEGFVDDLVAIVSRSKNAKLRQAVLDLLSAACIDGPCREMILKKCSAWLKELVAGGSAEKDAVMAALVLTKARGVGVSLGKDASGIVQDDESLVDVFKSMLLLPNDGESTVQIAIEGLAYESIKRKMKQTLVNDSSLLKQFFKVLKEHQTNATILFGGLTIISNLSMYPPSLSADQKRMAQLKAYANHSKSTQEDHEEEEEKVTARCKKLIDAGVASVIVSCSKIAASTTVQLIANIMLSLTRYTKHCGLLVQQGLFDTMLRYANISAIKDGAMQIARHQATVALARTLIPINPALIFNKVPVESAVRPLLTLLDTADTASPMFSGEPGRDIEPVFEALRALTNLASMDEPTRIAIAERGFPLITSQLWSNNPAIIQATTECILNLTVSHSAASKFFLPPPITSAALSTKNTENKESHNQTIHLLTALTHSTSPGTRRAATATLAHILAWSEGVTSFLSLDKGVATLMSVITDSVGEGDVEWLTRGTMAILLLLTTEMEDGQSENRNAEREGHGSEEAKRRVRMAKGRETFKAMKASEVWKENDMAEMIDEILFAL